MIKIANTFCCHVLKVCCRSRPFFVWACDNRLQDSEGCPSRLNLGRSGTLSIAEFTDAGEQLAQLYKVPLARPSPSLYEATRSVKT